MIKESAALQLKFFRYTILVDTLLSALSQHRNTKRTRQTLKLSKQQATVTIYGCN